MTNEEIYKAATNHAREVYFASDSHSYLHTVEYLEQIKTLIRSSVAQAYEEAAQVAVDHRENSLNGCSENGCGDAIADEICALKDSLVAETVS